jgi:hypothetical protein
MVCRSLLLQLHRAGHIELPAKRMALGLTSGRGHNARTSRRDQPRKELWVYPLRPDFRQRLTGTDE